MCSGRRSVRLLCADCDAARRGRIYVFFHRYRVVSFVVPDLSDCQLKPYVSYKGAKVESSVITADHLLAVVDRVSSIAPLLNF